MRSDFVVQIFYFGLIGFIRLLKFVKLGLGCSEICLQRFLYLIETFEFVLNEFKVNFSLVDRQVELGGGVEAELGCVVERCRIEGVQSLVRRFQFLLQLVKRLSYPFQVAGSKFNLLFLLIELVLKENDFPFTGLFLFDLKCKVFRKHRTN